MRVLGHVFHEGVQPDLEKESLRSKTLLTDLAAWLDHSGVSREEDLARRAAIGAAISAVDDEHLAAMVSPGGVTPRPSRQRPPAPPVMRSIGVDTSDLEAGDWTQHELVVLLRQVIERDPAAPGALLRRDTNLYCFIHTNLRAILIADVDGVGLGSMWSTPEAKAVLRLVQQHPSYPDL
jgi:hypothetical protein